MEPINTPRKTKCLGCGYPITWRDQRIQFVRASTRGVPRDEAKLATPRCQKCMTKYLKARDSASSIEAIRSAKQSLEDLSRHAIDSCKGLKSKRMDAIIDLVRRLDVQLTTALDELQ